MYQQLLLGGNYVIEHYQNVKQPHLTKLVFITSVASERNLSNKNIYIKYGKK